MKLAVVAEADVLIDIRDLDVVERVTGPGGDEWRSQFYGDIKTAEDIAAHFAFNALSNGVFDVNRLEGWGDCDPDAVEIIISDIDTTVAYTL